MGNDKGRLGALRAVDRDALVTEFQALDREQMAGAAAQIINVCANRRPTSKTGEAGIIDRQAGIDRRHMPIRTLLDRAGRVAQLLKPCFMMSPLSVSQYLPPSLRFDTVIFDEASQVKPSDAVNCVYRGPQLIVAGDQKQLPPTSFGQRIGTVDDDTYDEDQLDEFESLLDLCKAGARSSLPLNWHYRSKHKALITYSNYEFYNGGLLTFPGATDEAPDVGIELFKVDGVYRRGGAVRRIVADAHSITHDELSRHVARLFGWQRRGHDIRAILDEITSDLLRSGDLYEEDGNLTGGAAHVEHVSEPSVSPAAPTRTSSRVPTLPAGLHPRRRPRR